jgi:hypothetical protein
LCLNGSIDFDLNLFIRKLLLFVEVRDDESDGSILPLTRDLNKIAQQLKNKNTRNENISNK